MVQTQVPLTEQEWKGIDTLVAQLLREPITFTRLPSSMNIGPGKQKAEFYKATDIRYIEEGISFSYDQRNVPARIVNDAIITYLTEPIHIDAQRLAASGSTGITSLLVQMEVEARAAILQRIENKVFHGSDQSNGAGMINYAGVGDVVPSAVYTTPGSFLADLESGISDLRSEKIMPPYSLFMTPGIQSQLRVNDLNAGVGARKTEWVEFLEIYMNWMAQVNMPVLIDEVVATANIVDAALSNTNQAWMLFKNDINVGYIAESYPLHRADIPLKQWADDIDYTLRWAGTYVPKNLSGVTVCDAITTTNPY